MPNKDIEEIGNLLDMGLIQMDAVCKKINVRLGEMQMQPHPENTIPNWDPVYSANITDKSILILYKDATDAYDLYKSFTKKKLGKDAINTWITEYTLALVKEAIYWFKYLNMSPVGVDGNPMAGANLLDESKETKKHLIDLLISER